MSSIRSGQSNTETETTGLDAIALWNLVPDALLAVESNGRIAAANDAAAAVFGADTGELVGQSVEVLIDASARESHAGSRNRWMKVRTRRLMGSRPVFSARTLDGRRIEVQVALNPIQINGQRMTIAVVRDVSRRTALLREQASTREELSQRLFGLGMSLRSVIQGIEAAEPARRIEVVVDGMSDVVDALESETQRRSAALLDDEN
jgi:PAS domain S-box-containing protein